MDAELLVSCEEISDEDLQNMVFELTGVINDETEITANVAEKSGRAGSKGDVITMGHIVLTALSSGTVVALINVLKTYVSRKKTFKFEIQKNNGDKIILDAQNTGGNQINAMIKIAQDFAEDGQ